MPPKCQNMRIFIKYAKIRQSDKYAAIAYSRFSDMPLDRTTTEVTEHDQ